jgi:tetratricopeptide (TPR) repeat protein
MGMSDTPHIAVIKAIRANLKRALRARHYTPAEGLLEQLKNEDPLSVETRGLELEYLLAVNRWSEASSLALQLLKLFPDSARIHYLAARVNYQAKDYRPALSHFREAQRLYPHWLTRRWLGKTCTQLGLFEEAEAMLIDLPATHPQVGLDLAWLYERRDDPQRALQYLNDYLAWRPEDGFAKAQRLRLQATTLSPGELVEEVNTLMELDEPVPLGLLVPYVQRLLETGQSAAVRQFIAQRRPHWEAQVAASIAWVCYHLQAYDLALQLFLQGLPTHAQEYKYLSALEKAAVHCQRVDDVIEAYEALATDEKHLYGRIKTLEKRR